MTAKSCLVCGIPSTKQCSSCKTASYCNEEHQKKDWRSHKEYCLKVKAAGANTFDAILFGVNEIKPRLVKIPWELEPGDEEDPDPYHKLDTDVWFKYPHKLVRTLQFHRWGINGPELGRGLCIEYDDHFSFNGSPVNRCVVEATGGKAGHQWCGNLLALRMKGSSYGLYESVVMEEDLKPFVTYFEEYGQEMPVR